MSRKPPRRQFDYTGLSAQRLSYLAERVSERFEVVELELIKARMIYTSCSRPGDLRHTMRNTAAGRIRSLTDQRERLRLRAAALRLAQEGYDGVD